MCLISTRNVRFRPQSVRMEEWGNAGLGAGRSRKGERERPEAGRQYGRPLGASSTFTPHSPVGAVWRETGSVMQRGPPRPRDSSVPPNWIATFSRPGVKSPVSKYERKLSAETMR